MFATHTALAADFQASRASLADIEGVYVVVEKLQPNLQKYIKRPQLSVEELQRRVEAQLNEAGIKVYDKDQWLRAAGRPILYINVNTHEYQKYQFAYDIKAELQQIVSLDANPRMRLMAATWSSDMTGAVDTGTVQTLFEGVKAVVGLFIKACLSSRPCRP